VCGWRGESTADLHEPAICVVTHDDSARIARQALRRFRGDARAGLRAPTGLANRRPPATSASTWTTTWYRSPGAPGLMPWCSALAARRPSASACCWSIVGGSATTPTADVPAGTSTARAPLIQLLARRRERLHEHGTALGLQPPVDHDHAVSVRTHVQGAAPVAPRWSRPLRPCDPSCASRGRCARESDTPGQQAAHERKPVVPAAAGIEHADEVEQSGRWRRRDVPRARRSRSAPPHRAAPTLHLDVRASVAPPEGAIAPRLDDVRRDAIVRRRGEWFRLDA